MKMLNWGLMGLLLGACSSGEPVDIGNDGVSGERLSDYAASWEGYVEAYEFEDGSDRVRLTLASDGSGTVEIGASSPLAPATDPEVWPYYPFGSDRVRVDEALLPGFVYSIHQATVTDARLRLSVEAREPFRSWCALQTPVPVVVSSDDEETTVYRCMPNTPGGGGRAPSGPRPCWYTDPDTGDEVPVDCGKASLCKVTGICACTPDECDAGPLVPLELLDAALDDDGERLVGTLVLEEARLNVRFERVD